MAVPRRSNNASLNTGADPSDNRAMPSSGAFRRIASAVGIVYAAAFVAEIVYFAPKMGHRAAPGAAVVDLINSVACFLIAGIVVWRRPDYKPARLAFWAGAIMAFFFLDEVNYLLLIRGWPAPPWALPLAFLNPWQLVVFYLAVNSFPVETVESPLWRMVRRGVLVVGAMGWVASLTAVAQLWKIAPFYAWLAPLGVGPRSPNGIAIALVPPLIYAALALAAVRNYRALQSPRERRRIQWVLAALVVAAASMLLFHAVNAMRPFSAGTAAYLNLPGLLIPLAAGYALVTDQLLGVRVVIRMGLRYLLARQSLEALTLLPLAILGVQAWRNPNLSVAQLIHPPEWYVVCVVLGVAGLASRTRVQAALDKKFFREDWDREQGLTGLLESIRTGASFADTVDEVRGRLASLFHPEWVEVVYAGKRGLMPAPEVREAAEVEIAFPGGLGQLRLGPRKADIPYSPDDRRFLSIITSHLALAHDNHLLAGERADAVMAERTRMARELHDTLAQGFTGISLHLEAARQALEGDLPRAETHLTEARALARSSLAEARRSVHDLRTSGDLRIRLKRLIDDYARAGRLQVSLECKGDLEIQEPVAGNLYRIVQESLTNIVKHADATQADVSLEMSQHSLSLRIRDNGRGFDPGAAASGYGLAGMRERARDMGAELSVESRSGGGATIHLVREWR